MGLSNGILTEAYSTSDIARCLGVSTGELGDLLVSSRINLWAKYKPVRFGADRRITDEERKLAGWGVTATSYAVGDASVRQEMISNAINGNFGWSHAAPRGISASLTEWGRQLDFDGYNHNALCPFFFENYYTADTVELKIRIGQRSGLPSGNLSVTDITGIIGLDDPSLSGYGFILKKGAAYTHVDAINSAGTGVNYPLSQTHEIVLTTVQGTYDVCAYIRDYNRGTAVLVPLPALHVTVTAPLANVKINASLSMQSSSKSKFTFTITGQKSTGVTAGTATLRIYNSAGGSLGMYNFAIPFLANGASYSLPSPEVIEIPFSTIARWTFSYSGVTVNG